MTMETSDAFTLFTAGLALGLMLGRWLGKAERKLEYERGRIDGINLLWPHLVAYWKRDILASHRKPAEDPQDGGGAGA
jgi:hypothetical protein